MKSFFCWSRVRAERGRTVTLSLGEPSLSNSELTSPGKLEAEEQNRAGTLSLGKPSCSRAELLHWGNLSLEQGYKLLHLTVTCAIPWLLNARIPFHLSCDTYSQAFRIFYELCIITLQTLFLSSNKRSLNGLFIPRINQMCYVQLTYKRYLLFLPNFL